MPAVKLDPTYGTQAAALDIVFGMTTKALDALQRLSDLSMQAMKETIADNQEIMRQAFAVRDPQELFALQANSVESAAEKSRVFLQQVHEITAATRDDFQKVVEAQYETSKHSLQEIFDRLMQSAPAGSKGALDAWQAAMLSGATFCESLRQSTRQAVELAENQVASAAAVAAKAAHKPNIPSARAAAKR
ncbi:phasin family protein [Cupriavidus sp. IK-TO18]|nr:phasin family protein [Cupriavidus sp. IK-TO18]